MKCHYLLAYPAADERVCGADGGGVGAAARHAAGLGIWRCTWWI